MNTTDSPTQQTIILEYLMVETNMDHLNKESACSFDRIYDDLLLQILDFVGQKSFSRFAAINQKCKQIFDTFHLPKESFLYGCASLRRIKKRTELVENKTSRKEILDKISKGVVNFDRMDLLHWSIDLAKQNFCLDLLRDICTLAVEKGRRQLLEEVFNNSNQKTLNYIISKTSILCERASREGHLSLLIWLLEEKQCKFSEKVSKEAAQSGHIQILQWFRQNHYKYDVWGCIYVAALKGHLNILEFLQEEDGFTLGPSACDAAAQGGNVSVMKWLRSNGCKWNLGVCIHGAAREGKVEMIDYLLDNEEHPFDSELCLVFAAKYGHVNILRLIRRKGYDDWNTKISDEAARAGKTNVLKFLKEEVGCKLDLNACLQAARCGHLTTLQYLRENIVCESQWDDERICNAATVGRSHIQILTWLRDIGCVWNSYHLFLSPSFTLGFS